MMAREATAETMTDSYLTYQQLVARIEAFGQSVYQRYPTQMTCHAGCEGCCYQQFTIFPVEAYHIAQAVAALSPVERQLLRDHLRPVDNPWQIVSEAEAEMPLPCVLLKDGRCSLYEGRPLICRLQGYPLSSEMIERPGGKTGNGGQRDCCPLNFTELPLESVDAQAVFNLDLVNQTLAAINHLFVQEHGQPDQRVSIRGAVLDALDALDAIDLTRGDHEDSARL